jgi:hypothetical protein
MFPDGASVQARVVTTQESDPVPARVRTHRFLAELRLPIQGERDLSWIGRSLHAACRRLGVTSPCPQIVSAVYSPADERLVCMLEATSCKSVRDLFEIALLPPVRVLEVVNVEVNRPRLQPD